MPSLSSYILRLRKNDNGQYFSFIYEENIIDVDSNKITKQWVMRLMEEIPLWKTSLLSSANLYLTNQNRNRIKVNRINQGMSWTGWNPSSDKIMKTETHHRR